MSLLRPREYQDDAIAAPLAYWAAGGGNPLIEMATGLGKSVVIALIIKRLLTDYPSMRILMLVDSPELVEQNFLELLKLWPQAPAGIYAAKLGRRDAHHQITFAMIQSVHRRAASLGPRQLVLIDEAQMVPHEGEGMYRRLLAALLELDPNARLCGLTATPFRMKGGALVGGDGSLFDDVVYSYGLAAGIEDGWLTPLVSRPGGFEVDVSKVKRGEGEFTDAGLKEAFDQQEITEAAVSDMIGRSGNRKGWLVFCTGVQHAQNVAAELNRQGVRAEAIWGDMDGGFRREAIKRFKAGDLDALTSDAVLVKGFNAPIVRMIALLGAMLSSGKLVQIVGRGTRTIFPHGFNANDATAADRRAAIASGDKPDCMVLDYAGNFRRHGPVDTIVVGPKRAKGEKDPDAVTVKSVKGKECPQCSSIAGFTARWCKDCDHEWPVEERAPEHEIEAEDVAVLSKDLKKTNLVDEVPVMAWAASIHEKYGSAPSVKITYSAGVAQYPEWLAFEHMGPARERARRFWETHGGLDPAPRTASEGVARFGELRRPTSITTKKNGKWFDITGRRFALSQDTAA